jgi:hypothetical protein
VDAGALALSLRPPASLRAGADARWELHVTNRSTHPVTLTFPTAQPGDVSLEREGTERFRWSEGRAFAQVIEERSLAPGEGWTCALEGPLEVDPGRYEAVGTVACRPSPPAVRAAVVVEAAGPPH